MFDIIKLMNLYNFTYKELYQTTTIQIWLGTSYGSAILLSSQCQTLSQQANNDGGIQSSGSGGGVGGTQKVSTITTTGTIHSLKGEIMNISFLDMNANLIITGSPVVNNGGLTSSSSSSGTAATGSGATSKTTVAGDEVEEDFLNMDMDFSYQASNSIADNFGTGNNSGGGTTDQGSTGGGTNSSPSPTSTTPTVNSTFVNPFTNPPPSATNPVAPFDEKAPPTKLVKRKISSISNILNNSSNSKKFNKK